ncbi:enoyl-CoA hydratase [Novosphingobium sp. PASSN1]|uniref:enoyl-CoA hydratase n=1 Tax=Novosphingobium sp. PASSN1 TaxID=2015561 RepID=UPI000BCEEFE7|nr:enoyl-CoA hydratase [Novosphingobium sp. PASSN1]OYU34925.1 MAG: enoyl-CoA hydratase [Novosphingobium sp. PASSN1]
MVETPQFEDIRYDLPAPGVARVTLARPDKHNAQSLRMLYEINDALDLAMDDDDVNVVIVAADGKNFSSGHDLSDTARIGDLRPPVLGFGGYRHPGPQGHMSREQEVYLGFCWRWRNLPKPIIVQVQGKAIAGGLMLIWPFDLIIAADDAEFSDPVVAFGMNGHEFFVHAFELGHRKAKQMLFTGEALGAAEAKALGMVNEVVPRAELESFTIAMATKIASRPAIGLKTAKMSVNQSMDAQGMWNAIQSAFNLHQFGHANNRAIYGQLVDPAGLDIIRSEARASRERGGQG